MPADRPPNATETLPDGTVIDFYDTVGVDGEKQTRRYLVNGARFVNVTTILDVLSKESLLDWVARLTREGQSWRAVRNEAGERGHGMHHLLLEAMTGSGASLAGLSPEWRPWGRAAFKWLRHRRPEVLLSEQMIASSSVHGYAGRLDLLANIDASRTLVDFKSITKWAYIRAGGELTDEKYPPYAENLLQLDLYQGALVECGFEPAERGLVVRLGPDAEFEETFVDLDPRRGVAILAAYKARQRANSALKKAAHAAHVESKLDQEIAEAVAEREAVA
jgi:hypothetical protein